MPYQIHNPWDTGSLSVDNVDHRLIITVKENAPVGKNIPPPTSGKLQQWYTALAGISNTYAWLR